MKIIFATHNRNKHFEVAKILPKNIELLSLDDIGCFEDIAETSETIEGNAIQKAEYVYTKYKIPVFADDTGLEIEALNGQPGVYSARWAGDNCTYNDNVVKALSELDGADNRNARFKTVIAFFDGESPHLFEGIIEGEITKKQKGAIGFGYDPIFLPHGYKQTFAEMDIGLKNKISHRGLAMEKFLEFLNHQD